MKNLQISIIGDGLTGLVTALSMANLNLKVDVYWRKNEKKNNIKDERVTAISKSNLNFLWVLLIHHNIFYLSLDNVF